MSSSVNSFDYNFKSFYFILQKYLKWNYHYDNAIEKVYKVLLIGNKTLPRAKLKRMNY